MLKILVINEVSPQIKNRTSILFEKIVPILCKKNEVKIFWLSTDKIEEKGNTGFKYESLYWKNFKNAKEVIEKINPSLIYLFPGQSIIDYSFLLASRQLQIPTCGWVEGTPMFGYNSSRKKYFKEQLRNFFVKKQTGTNNISFRGISFIQKNLFFIKTARSIGKTYYYIMLDLFQQFQRMYYLETRKEKNNAKFDCDLLLIENEYSVEYGSTHGLSKEKMVMVGDPNYDLAFKKRCIDDMGKIEKYNVLFITVNISSQADSNWSIHEQSKMIKELCNEYKKWGSDFSLSIKIHPVSEDFDYYKKNIDKHNVNIKLFQHENIYELIEKADVILTTATSTAGSIGLIMNKPIILCNYFQVENDQFLESKVAIKCENISNIKDSILMAKSFNQKNEFRIKKFIKKFYGDGNSIQKIVNIIENLMKTNTCSK
jgi:hypothetical protein